MKSLKLNICMRYNFIYFCAEILVDSEWLDSAGAFKPEQLKYITCIFEYTCISRFIIWSIQNHKDVAYFIKKLCMCDNDVIWPEDIIKCK